MNAKKHFVKFVRKDYLQIIFVTCNQLNQVKIQKVYFFFYDFETQQCERVEGDDKITIHVPNLCVVQQVYNFCDKNTDISTMCTCGVREYVFDRDPAMQFIDLVFTKRKTFKHIICIAHNAQGFDS